MHVCLEDNEYSKVVLFDLAKVCERIEFLHLPYTSVAPYVSFNQHTFVPGRSTATDLSIIVHDIAQCLEADQRIDVIYTNFMGAFESVNHDLLLRQSRENGLQ